MANRYEVSDICGRREEMIFKIDDTQKAGELFGDWPETIIWSCLQNVMGDIYADDPEHPNSAMAVLGDFCFFSGQPNRELVLYKPEDCRSHFIIMIPQNDGWGRLITACYQDKAKKVKRYAMKKEPLTSFDKSYLQTAAASLKPGYSMRMIDEAGYHVCKSSRWSRDLVSQYVDYDTYKRLGLGVVITKGTQLVAGASAYSRYENGIEVEIDTNEEYRRKGLAYACGARLILECLQRGLYPSWDAQNLWSVALAEKLGYHYDYTYPAYEIWGY